MRSKLLILILCIGIVYAVTNDDWEIISAGESVEALTATTTGNIYVGGEFSTIGGVSASKIAKWDGSSWSALGSGIGTEGVYDIAIDASGNVYAGGLFSTAGGNSANNIAMWDGTSWSALGSGVNEMVWNIAINGSGDLYAGGQFTTAGGILVNGIAKWNGSSWSALGTGVDMSVVFGIAIDNADNVIAGGFFTSAGGVSANNIAKWNGLSWSALGSGTNSAVTDIIIDNAGNIYASGDFTTAGGSSANHIAKWNGSSWSALGDGTDDDIAALAYDNISRLYVGGYFSTAGGKASPNLSSIVVGTEIPTPITLTSFDYAINNGGVTLTWHTASETENSAFRIYRNNVLIAELDGAGNTSEPNTYEYTDDQIIPGNTYTYILADISYANEETKYTDKAVTISIPENNIPTEFSLEANYPNPFNPTTAISYQLSASSNVDLSIFDMNGKEVATLVNGSKPVGYHSVKWDASNVSSGIYFYRLQAGDFVDTKKMVFMK